MLESANIMRRMVIETIEKMQLEEEQIEVKGSLSAIYGMGQELSSNPTFELVVEVMDKIYE